MRAYYAVLASVVVSLVGASACKGKDKQASSKGGDAAAEGAKLAPLPEPKMIPNRDEEPLTESEVMVQLPPYPSPERLSPPDVPLIYDDGAYSIQGLRQDFDKQIKAGEGGQEVEVRAWVQRIYVPPLDCKPEGDCRQPHLWIGDASRTKARRHQMLVANTTFSIPEWDAKRWANQPEVILEVGKQYLFKGRFLRFGDTGFMDPRGLLQFTAVAGEDGEWIYPRGAPWHPIEVERQERANAELMERVMENERRHERKRGG